MARALADMDGDRARSSEEIALRTLALSSSIACAKGAPKKECVAWLKTEGIWPHVTPQEKKFLTRAATDQQRVDITWRLEALAVLLWSIQKLDRLPPLGSPCDTAPMVSAVIFPPNRSLPFVLSARRRPIDVIEAEGETIYNAHWKIRDAELNNRRAPRGILADAIVERHHAFNWIVGYGQQKWDHVTTDT